MPLPWMSRKSAALTTFSFGIAPPLYGGTDEQTAANARLFLHAFDQLVHTLGLQNRLVVTHIIAVVVDLDQHVAIAAIENPLRGVIRRANNRGLITQSLVLAEVEVTEDNYHPEFVCPIDDAFEPLHVIRAQGAILDDGRVVPRLVFRVALRRAALQIDCEREQAVVPPLRHRRDELARVALCVPLASIWIRPLRNRVRVQIIEDALEHARVEE